MSKSVPAFPTQTHCYDGHDNVLQYQEDGMTLRDYFAAQAMGSLVKEFSVEIISNNQTHYECIVTAAYRMADAMLKARENSNE